MHHGEPLENIAETEWDILLRAHNEMLHVGKQSNRFQRGPEHYVPTVLDLAHNRTMTNRGVVGEYGVEAFSMHLFDAEANVLGLHCVGRELGDEVFLHHVPYFTCAGQGEYGINPKFIHVYKGRSHDQAVTPGLPHSHCGYPCDLIPHWFKGHHPELDYETAIAKDFPDSSFVSTDRTCSFKFVLWALLSSMF